MRAMHATVVVFPGSNADAEMIRTLRDVMGVRTSTAWHRDAELPARLAGVLATIYLVFNEGYLPRSAETAVRTDLSEEAIRLARVVRELMPDEPEATGLLALLLLIDARRPARVVDGLLVPLDVRGA